MVAWSSIHHPTTKIYPPLYIRAIQGAYLWPQETGEYDVTVVGVGIGAIDEGNRVISTRWTVNGTELTADQVSSSHAHQVLLRFPSGLISDSFSDRSVEFASITVQSQIQRPRKFLFITIGSEITTYTTQFRVALMPRVAATIDELAQSVTYQGRSELRYSDHRFYVPDEDGAKERLWESVFDLPADAELANLSVDALSGFGLYQPNQQGQRPPPSPYGYNCVPDPGGPDNPGSYCAWCNPRSGGPGWALADCEITNRGPSGTRVICYRRCESGHSTVHHRLGYTVSATRSRNLTQRLHLDMRTGIPREINLPPSNSDGNYRITGHTASGAQFVLFSGQRDDARLGLHSTVERAGDHFRVIVFAEGQAPFTRCN